MVDWPNERLVFQPYLMYITVTVIIVSDRTDAAPLTPAHRQKKGRNQANIETTWKQHCPCG